MVKEDNIALHESRDPDRRDLLLASLLEGDAGLSAVPAQATVQTTDIKKGSFKF